MEITKDNLILTQTKSSQYRFSYEPCDDVTPSAEGVIEIDSDSVTEYSDRGEAMFSDSTLNGIDFVKIKVWDCEGFQEITETDLGQLFIKELETLILNELN